MKTIFQERGQPTTEGPIHAQAAGPVLCCNGPQCIAVLPGRGILHKVFGMFGDYVRRVHKAELIISIICHSLLKH